MLPLCLNNILFLDGCMRDLRAEQPAGLAAGANVLVAAVCLSHGLELV